MLLEYSIPRFFLYCASTFPGFCEDVVVRQQVWRFVNLVVAGLGREGVVKNWSLTDSLHVYAIP